MFGKLRGIANIVCVSGLASISEHLLRVVPVAALRRQCEEVEIFRLWWQLYREQRR